MIRIIVTFIKRPEWFVRYVSWKKLLFIFLLNTATKTTYNMISSHPFLPEMNFEFAGIVNPTIWEFITSHLISDLLFFGVFLTVLVVHMREKISLRILLDVIIAVVSILFISNYSKSSAFIYLSVITLILLFFLKRNFNEYLISLRIMISIQIFNILSTILLYISELFSSNILFIATLFIYSILSFGYFIRLIRASYEISVKKILLYSIISLTVAVIYGFAIYKADIFSTNTIKLILYN